ncbi:Pimeloyl-ACP methyl ester carboxylesterase [Blastococcus fimeti]|nr:Pimeloyl-ACP methyl ester carboxylesterase [Blastococcus fimeti]
MTGLKGRSTRGYVSVPWGQAHYRVAGDDGAPTVLLLHQSPLSSATYEPVLPLLAARGVRAVAVDTPGYGMSDAPPSVWSIPEYAHAAWTFADALGLDRVTLLGQHTGAVVAAEAARRAPGRVAGLVFQGLPLYSDDERAEKMRSWAPGYSPAEDGSHLAQVWGRIHDLYPDIGLESADRQVVEYLSVGADYAPAYRAVFGHEVDTAALASVPTLLLHGDRDLVARMDEVVTAAFPHARLHHVRGGTDFAHEEFPEAFAEELATFVRSSAQA